MLVTLALVLALTPALPAAAARATVGGLRANEVSFVGSGDVVLHGTVLAPSASAQRRPGLVMLQGAGIAAARNSAPRLRPSPGAAW
jgi:uncharacterized protein